MPQQHQIKTLVLGYNGAKNLGDDIMLKAIILWLEKQGRQATVISEDPSDTRSRFQVKSVLNVSMFLQWGWVGTIFKGQGFPLVRALFKCDELLVGGGDLIRDIRGWKGFWYTMEKILIARLLSKQVFLVGVGIAEPTKKWSRFCLKHLLKRCKKIYVRDLRSLNLCQSFDLTNVKLMPDIATVLKSYHTDNYPKVAQTKQKYCLVTFRYDPNVYGGFEIGTKHYINIARALDLLIEQTGMKVIFSPYQEHKDNLIHQELVSYMQHKEACTIKPWNADVMAVFNMASNAELVIAMRLHAIIIGACMKVPCVALPYDYKIDEFCKLAGIKDKIYPEDMLDVGRTLDIIKHSLSHRHNNEYLPGTMWDNASLD